MNVSQLWISAKKDVAYAAWDVFHEEVGRDAPELLRICKLLESGNSGDGEEYFSIMRIRTLFTREFMEKGYLSAILLIQDEFRRIANKKDYVLQSEFDCIS